MKSHSAQSPIMWVDGNYLSDDKFSISALSRGLGLGVGVFETLRSYSGRAFEFEKHYQRLTRGAGLLGLVVPSTDTLLNAINGVVVRNGFTEMDCRLKVSIYESGAASSVVVTASNIPVRSETVCVDISQYRVNEFSSLAGVKSTSYAMNVIALREANERGYDESLMLNTQGEVCEGTTSNLFLVKDDELWTPNLESGCLAGVARSTIIEICQELEISCVERAISLGDLDLCEEAFLTNSLREVHPINRIGERILAHCPGGLTGRLKNAYKERVNGAK